MEDAMTSIKEFIRDVAKGEENSLEIVKQAMVGPDGKTKEGDCFVVSLQNRKLQPEPPAEPIKAESPRRMHMFHDIDGFVDYLKVYKTDNTVVLADVPNMTAYATLDEKAAKGYEVIRLQPAIHPLFRPWKELLEGCYEGEDEPMTVQAFAEFILVNRRAVIEPDAKDLVIMLSQVKASKKIEINRGRGMKSLNGFTCETTIQGASTTDLIVLPDSIKIKVPIFVQTAPVEIAIDLLAVAGDANVYMKTASADVETAKVEAFRQMIEKCRKLEKIVVGTGTPATAGWQYLQ